MKWQVCHEHLLMASVPINCWSVFRGRQVASFSEARQTVGSVPNAHRFFVRNGSQGFVPRREQFLSATDLIADELHFQSNVSTGMFSVED
jgi:hypothetical protein